MARLRRDYEKYDAEEREAADQLAEYQQRATEALARLQRVRKLKQEVKERGDQVFSRGMEAIDAWDGVIQQEPIIGDWPSSNVGLEFLDLGTLVPSEDVPSSSS